MEQRTVDEQSRTDTIRPARLAVLISGSGRTLANLIDRIADRSLAAQIVAVVSSRPGVRGVQIANDAGIPVETVKRSAFPDDSAFSAAIYAFLEPFAPDLIILAGFMKRIEVSPAWEGRILNIHPCLIPESNAAGQGFYGERVHEAVIESGAVVSGATVHVVDAEYDHGPVVLKETVPVLPDDTPADLAGRVFALEMDLYPRAITRYLADHPEITVYSTIECER